MNRIRKTLAFSTLAAALVLPAGAVADRADVNRLAEAKISLVDAITIAEKSQGGRAYEAGIDDDSPTPEYEVSVSVGDKVFEVSVDGITGEVRKVREDRDD